MHNKLAKFGRTVSEISSHTDTQTPDRHLRDIRPRNTLLTMLCIAGPSNCDFMAPTNRENVANKSKPGQLQSFMSTMLTDPTGSTLSEKN